MLRARRHRGRELDLGDGQAQGVTLGGVLDGVAVGAVALINATGINKSKNTDTVS